jgi:hypothetical protein
MNTTVLKAPLLVTLEDMLRKAPDTNISLHRGHFTSEGNLESGGWLVYRGIWMIVMGRMPVVMSKLLGWVGTGSTTSERIQKAACSRDLVWGDQ